MGRVRLGIILILAITSFLASFVEARILGPAEAEMFIQQLIERSTSQNFWGLWQEKDRISSKNRFLEVIFLENGGFGWTNLKDDHSRFSVEKDGLCYVFDVNSQQLIQVYPLLDFPFLPLRPQEVPLFLENYLVDLQGDRVFFLERESGEIKRSLLLDNGSVRGQTWYQPDGRVKREGKFVYQDFTPEWKELDSWLEIMEQALPQASLSYQTSVSLSADFPQVLVPGFRLLRIFLVKNKEGEWHQLVYGDGLQRISLVRSRFPYQFSSDFLKKTITVSESSQGTTIVEKDRGHLLIATGDFSQEMFQAILESIK